MRHGQAIVEYAILIGIVTAAILGMQIYAKRGVQAGVKMMADRMSPAVNDPQGERAQLEGMRYESGDRRTSVVSEGAVLIREAQTRTRVRQDTQVATTAGGGVTRTIRADETTTTGDLGDGVALRAKVVADVRE
jgi:Flp pilus assembly pilin Flp